jgi:hypothetical protein
VGLGGLFVASAIAPLAASTPNPGPGANASKNSPVASFDASEEVPLQYLSRDNFARLIGTRFTVHTANSRTVPLTLIAVEDLTATTATTTASHSSGLRAHMPMMAGKVPAPSTQKMDTYALRFRGFAGKALTQDTYVFESGGLGKIALFIVPCSKNMRIPTYTAIINRLQ